MIQPQITLTLKGLVYPMAINNRFHIRIRRESNHSQEVFVFKPMV
jgi:hypothetical protein